MKILSYDDSGYARFVKRLKRRAIPTDDVRESVTTIISEVAKRGDAALVDFAKKFDGATSRNPSSGSVIRSLRRRCHR